ncbi:MAG TPA: DNA/RNA non-specific endonuclease, partial [Herpetosiphonaceae bacterium]
MATVRPTAPRLAGWMLVALFLAALAALAPRPSAQAQSVASLHLALGNPSGAVTSTSAPTNYLIQKNQYALSYHKDNGIPNWVSWHLSAQDMGSASRCDCFSPDSSLPSGWYRVVTGDYTGSGYDRGHMTPSGERTATSADNAVTFHMTNIIPQAPDNNQGPWNALENYARGLATSGSELYIISGGAGSRGTIGGGKVRIPDRTWKVIVVLPNGDNDLSRVSTSTRVIAVNLPNTQGIRSNSWESYRVSVDSIEALTGYDFLSNVSPAIQSVIEARVDGSSATPVPTTPPASTATPTPTRTPTATPTATPGGSACGLFFSEYVEGSSNNKALEIYNGGGASVDLAAQGYSVRLYANGATSATSSASLSGVLPSKGVYVIANSSASSA